MNMKPKKSYHGKPLSAGRPENGARKSKAGFQMLAFQEQMRSMTALPDFSMPGGTGEDDAARVIRYGLLPLEGDKFKIPRVLEESSGVASLLDVDDPLMRMMGEQMLSIAAHTYDAGCLPFQTDAAGEAQALKQRRQASQRQSDLSEFGALSIEELVGHIPSFEKTKQAAQGDLPRGSKYTPREYTLDFSVSASAAELENPAAASIRALAAQSGPIINGTIDPEE